jgi:hypothetical protein
MPSSINSFISSFDRELARPDMFDVTIPLPLKLLAYYNTGESLSLRCESAEMPGMSFITTEQKIYGPVEKYPREAVFNEATLTFALSGDMREKIFFDAWMNLINPSSSYDFAWKADYATTVLINQYDVSGQQTYQVGLNEAFPIAINQLDMDWSEQNSHHKLSVVFAYYTWTNTSFSSLGMSVLNAGISAAIDLGAQAIGNLIPPPTPAGPDWSMQVVANKFNGS